MSRVNLARLWYIFPPDDQELSPTQFERKVTSFLTPLAVDDKLAVLDFLMVQYAAFETQLEVMRAREVLGQAELVKRSERLSCHLKTLQRHRHAVQLPSGLDVALPR